MKNEKNRILFINGNMNCGGVEKSLLEVLKHLDYNKFDVDLLLLEEIGDYENSIPKEVNVIFKDLRPTYGPFFKCLLNACKRRDWHTIKMRLILLLVKLFGMRQIRKAKKYLTNNKHYDYVVGYRVGICSQVAAYACNAKKRITWWHDSEIDVNKEEYNALLKEFDIVVAVSLSTAKMLKDEFTAYNQKIICIYNMIDVVDIYKKSKAFSPNYNIEYLNFVTVCRLSKEKHVENAIFAASKLKDKGFKFCWHIVGDGSEKPYLQQLSNQYKVSENIIFEGNQPNPYPYIANSDLMIHTSYVESQCLSVLEAMALNIPCVVTRSKGPEEYIIDGVNGLFSEQSYLSLTDKIEEILSDKSLFYKIKQNSKCPNQFSVNAVIREIEKVIVD